MRPLLIRTFVVLACSALMPVAAGGSDWPQFRGRDAGVAVDNPGLPASWDTTRNVVWSTEIPGVGWSSPIVSGDHVFVTAVLAADEEAKAKPGLYNGGVVTTTSKAEHRWMVYDVSLATGKIRWQREVHRALPSLPKHQKNSYASETPVTDGTRVYAYFAGVGLFALNFEGQVLWSKEFADVKFRNGWGSGASPVLHRGRLYLVCDNEDQSFVAAFDAETGRELWRVNRKEGTNWSTPFVWEHDQRYRARHDRVGQSAIVRLERHAAVGVRRDVDDHDSNTVCAPRPPVHQLGLRRRPTPTNVRDQAGRLRRHFAGAWHDDATPTSHGRIRPSLPYNPTPLVYGDYLYTLLDRGFFTAHDARTGREIYGRQRIAADASGFTSSPWAYNDKIFVLSEDGDTYRPAARLRVQGSGKEPAGRDDARDPCGQ